MNCAKHQDRHLQESTESAAVLHRELRKLLLKHKGDVRPPFSPDTRETLRQCAITDVELDGFTYVLTRVPTTERKRLSARQQEISMLVAEGFPNKIIAQRLGISMATVAVHLQRIFRKLNIASRAELARQTVLLC